MEKKTEKERNGPSAQNHLADQFSPYLLQHASNPVDWYPWGEEAFNKALKENKPVFLSIGYSTCHWCHVMEKESFEDEEVAALMNDTFVCIKVDREERPNIDEIYMTCAQLMGEQGGWPLTILMTPQKEPFMVKTYIPKKSNYYRVGMLDLIPGIQEIWNDDIQREHIRQQSSLLMESLDAGGKKNKHEHGITELTDEGESDLLVDQTIQKTFKMLLNNFDELNGGFGHAPKFPTPHHLFFLLRYWKRYQDQKALEMVENTLLSMRKGGVYDQIGHGLHRYSTDSRWAIPHFEKMLYDQPLIGIAYIETYLATGKPVYSTIAREVLSFTLENMRSQKGGFYSAYDADSEGAEGKFYLWKPEQLRNILTEEELDTFLEFYQLEPFQEPFLNEHIQDSGIILVRPDILPEMLHSNDHNPENNVQSGPTHTDEYPCIFTHPDLKKIIAKIYRAREKRVAPFRDEKVLTDWNAMMIQALALAGRTFNETNYTNAAKECAEFVFSKLCDNEGHLLHCVHNNGPGIPAFLDDHAYMIRGCIELYETTFEVRYLKKAVELTEYQIAHFYDKEGGAFFNTSDLDTEFDLRLKKVTDGAIPSGNSVSAMNLIKLERLTGDIKYRNLAGKTLSSILRELKTTPIACTFLLSALEDYRAPSLDVVIAGLADNKDTRQMLQSLQTVFLPEMTLTLKTGDEPELEDLIPYSKGMERINGAATAYVCKDKKCYPPVKDKESLKELIYRE